MKRHNFLLFVGLLLAQVSYRLKRVYQELDNFKYIGERNVEGELYKFYLGHDKEIYDTLGLPEMTNKLMNCPVMTLSKKEKVYEIDVFKYVKMTSPEGVYTLGYFCELFYVDKNIVCIYKDGDRCEYDNRKRLSAKVVFSKGKGDIEIEKYFSGEPSEYVLKVTGNFLCNKRQAATVYYVVINKDGVIEPNEKKEKDIPIKEDKLNWANLGPDIIKKIKDAQKTAKEESQLVQSRIVIHKAKMRKKKNSDVN